MNLNILAYGIFIGIAAYIIIVIGYICYKNGNVYVLSLMPGHKDLCLRINRILLVGYYLLNIGYAATTLIGWKTISSLTELVEVTVQNTAVIMTILSLLHYLNIFLLANYAKKLI
ncbi:MAG TPA: hypothetical protein VEA37_00065 [Flavobacterium sp.]|nr:hypothetical protein [Flavobacterium sp.]